MCTCHLFLHTVFQYDALTLFPGLPHLGGFCPKHYSSSRYSFSSPKIINGILVDNTAVERAKCLRE